MILADVIFPILTTTNMTTFFFPWIIPLALVSEAAVFFMFFRELTAWRVISMVLGANAFSWLAGILIGILVPMAFLVFSTSRVKPPDNFFESFPEVGFVIALGISILIEYLVWAVVSTRQPPPSLLRAVTLANVVSYLVVITAFLIFRAALS